MRSNGDLLMASVSEPGIWPLIFSISSVPFPGKTKEVKKDAAGGSCTFYHQKRALHEHCQPFFVYYW